MDSDVFMICVFYLFVCFDPRRTEVHPSDLEDTIPPRCDVPVMRRAFLKKFCDHPKFRQFAEADSEACTATHECSRSYESYVSASNAEDADSLLFVTTESDCTFQDSTAVPSTTSDRTTPRRVA
jgi:hypothetical protein